MATITYYPGRASDMLYPPQDGVLLDHSDTSAEFKTAAVGDTKLFLGHDFGYENETLVAGTVTEVVYKAGGSDLYRITDVQWDVSLGLPDLFGGDDFIIGSRADDIISGGAGDDTIRGGKGRDLIRGEADNDLLRGGDGSDVFVFATGHGTDTIVDFDTKGAQQDVLRLAVPENPDFDVKQHGNDVWLDFGGDDRIILRHTELTDLSPRNFDLV